MNRYFSSTIIIFCGLLMSIGCSSNKHRIFAASGTVIGLELSQHPATQSPQAKLGYNRAEFAVVPTNRDDADSAGTVGEGASDVSDVLMELKYQGLLGGANSGIYQRLAVGSTAVSQPGAWLMFLKDNSGTVSEANADALQKAILAVPVLDTRQELGDLARAFSSAEIATQEKYDEAASEMGFSGFQGFLEAQPSDEQIRNLKSNVDDSQ